MYCSTIEPDSAAALSVSRTSCGCGSCSRRLCVRDRRRRIGDQSQSIKKCVDGFRSLRSDHDIQTKYCGSDDAAFKQLGKLQKILSQAVSPSMLPQLWETVAHQFNPVENTRRPDCRSRSASGICQISIILLREVCGRPAKT